MLLFRKSVDDSCFTLCLNGQKNAITSTICQQYEKNKKFCQLVLLSQTSFFFSISLFVCCLQILGNNFLPYRLGKLSKTHSLFIGHTCVEGGRKAEDSIMLILTYLE